MNFAPQSPEEVNLAPPAFLAGTRHQKDAPLKVYLADCFYKKYGPSRNPHQKSKRDPNTLTRI